MILKSYPNTAKVKEAAKVKGSGDASPHTSNAKSNYRTLKIAPTSLATLIAEILNAIATAVATATATVRQTPPHLPPQSILPLSTPTTPSRSPSTQRKEIISGPNPPSVRREVNHFTSPWQTPRRFSIFQGLNNSIRDLSHHAIADDINGRCGIPPSRPRRHRLLERRPWHPPKILKDIHVMRIENVQAFSGWFMGDTLSTLTASTDITIKAVDPNEAGN